MMADFLIGFLYKATNIFPEYGKAFTILIDECNHYHVQFNTFIDIEEAISLLSSTPVFVELYGDPTHRYDIEKLLLDNIGSYLYSVTHN